MPSQCIDVIDVLDGFFYLRQRSPTLNGDAPVRAVQACPPFAEGSAFGYEIRYSGIGIAIEPTAPTPVRMLDELSPGFDYPGTVAAAGHLITSAWFERLHANWWWRDEATPEHLHVWTGLLLRPRDGYWGRVTELFNSPHLRLRIAEQVFPDQEQFQPLVLSLDLLPPAALQPARAALAGAVACLSPLPDQSSLSCAPLATHPVIGERLLNYYDNAYFDEKLESPPTRKYAKLIREAEPEVAIGSDALILGIDEDDCANVEIQSFSQSVKHAPAFAEVRAPADMRFIYLGRGFQVAMGESWQARWHSARAQWQRLYGEPGAAYFERMTFDGAGCVHTTPGHPVLVANIEPLHRFVSRPGWVILFEGCSDTLRWGLRGCIRSSRFHAGVFAFQWFDSPQDTLISQGETLGRAIPLPASALDAQINVTPLTA